MASAIYSLPTISSCQAVSQTTRTTARWGLLPVTVELLDEIRQRQLPQFLTMIGELPEFVRVHFERACHLDIHVRQVPAASCIDPRSQTVRNERSVIANDTTLAAQDFDRSAGMGLVWTQRGHAIGKQARQKGLPQDEQGA